MPVMSFSYGFMTSSLQNASITIGPLECHSGSKNQIASQMASRQYCFLSLKMVNFEFSECDCSARGSFDGKTCANKIGSCKCKPNVVGPKCDRCTEGYFPYPDCDNWTCPQDKFKCRSSSRKKCIDLQWVCDGDNDCGDNYDEWGCDR